jgi:DNA polymerase-3 subunit epsilon
MTASLDHPPFVAIDFETADRGPDSACAVALVRVDELRITQRRVTLLRPPRSRIVFSYIHGITWAQVVDAPTFAEAWPELTQILDGAAYLVAHNAPFDRRVLETCCIAAGLPIPALPFQDSVRIARKTWKLKRANLPAVCAHLGLPLRHHDPASDAEACAQIVIAAMRAFGV